jgi:hypothetical protein
VALMNGRGRGRQDPLSPKVTILLSHFRSVSTPAVDRYLAGHGWAAVEQTRAATVNHLVL